MQVTPQQKYDRQLRLWKEHGQLLMQQARVLLLGCTATGTEVLKNLVLPGVGSFLIVDHHLVTERDLANMFFVAKHQLGQSRAQCCAQLLNELNEEVQGHFSLKSPAQWIEEDAETAVKDFQIIIATNEVPEPFLSRLSKICFDKSVPLLLIRMNGFIGYLRLQVKQHTVFETHPEHQSDLRLDCPWMELSNHANARISEWNQLDSLEREHTPFIVLLLGFLQKWQKNNGSIPSTREEKDAFKKWLMSHASADSENFQQASSNLFRLWSQTQISSSLQKLFQHQSCLHLNEKSDSFWILIAALKKFVAHEGDGHLLPLPGVLPDMKSDTKSYIALQNLYFEKSQSDLKAMRKYAAELCELVGRKTGIPDDELNRFCRHAKESCIVETQPIADEFEKISPRAGKELEMDDNLLSWYVLFRAADAFHNQMKRYPGTDNVDSDVALLRKCVNQLLSSAKLSSSLIPDEHIQEFCRMGMCELHAMAAWMGGVASQECIKLITRQYIPVDNTWILDGMKSRSQAFSGL